MVSLLRDNDKDVVEKVKRAIADKGLYGVLLLNSFDIHMGNLEEDDPASLVIMDILSMELESELSSEKLDLLRVLYLISLMEVDFFPFVEINDYIFNFVSKVNAMTKGDNSIFRKLDTINSLFFGEEKYAGNTEDYYNIKNSLIIEVIKRKKGIPLSLSILFMAIANRAGIPMQGLALPGHFMCRFEHSTFTGVIDVFNGGRMMSYNEAHWFLASMGHNIEVDKFPVATDFEIIIRTMKNMENVYIRKEKREKLHRLEVIKKLVERYV